MFNETYADSAFIEHLFESHGLCSLHARRFIDDGYLEQVCAPYEPVIRTLAHRIRRELRGRNPDARALDPARPCPWCDEEYRALDFALSRRSAERALCPAHARQHRTLVEMRRAPAFESPQPPARPLDPPPLCAPFEFRGWSPIVGQLLDNLQIACPACLDGRSAEAARVAFLRAGPTSETEHWDAPQLCVRHWRDVFGDRNWLPEEVADPRPPMVCGACGVAWDVAERSAGLGAICFGEDAFARAYAAGAGFCLPHVRIAAHAAPNRAALERLLDATCTRLETLAWELREHARRRAWQLRDQPAIQAVADAPLRALWMLGGGLARHYAAERFGTL